MDDLDKARERNLDAEYDQAARGLRTGFMSATSASCPRRAAGTARRSMRRISCSTKQAYTCTGGNSLRDATATAAAGAGMGLGSHGATQGSACCGICWLLRTSPPLSGSHAKTSRRSARSKCVGARRPPTSVSTEPLPLPLPLHPATRRATTISRPLTTTPRSPTSTNKGGDYSGGRAGGASLVE
jgi:hypothetical protein